VTEIRSRFAPAPSGSLHVGNVRTGLFSWAFARHSGGAFVLRLEDTDASRVTEEAVHGVIESLRWLGIDWDEGPDVGGPHAPYRQSQRTAIYEEQVATLLARGDAYPCFCTPEELEERREAARARGEPPGYDGRCRSLTPAEREAFEREGRPAAIRFRMPDTEHVVDDLVKGEVRFAPGALRDFVLRRSDGTPTFLLAVAVDDMLMGITHVVRGDDLLTSAPRNAEVIRALGATPPRYAHVPQVNGPDGRPLSKRHGSTSVESFREQGFVPEALMNYLALLGWSKDAQTTFLSKAELVEAFDLERVSGNPASFDMQKLEWMNNHYIQQLDDDDLAARCLPFLTHAGLSPEPAKLRAAMPLVRERMKRLTEAVDLLRFLFTDDVTPNEKARELLDRSPEGYLAAAADRLAAVERWTAEQIKEALDDVARRFGLNRTKGWQPIRAAVTGSNVSPPLPESLELLGREATVRRVRSAATPRSTPLEPSSSEPPSSLA
jgi:glutamyl-tRNA synthetase